MKIVLNFIHMLFKLLDINLLREKNELNNLLNINWRKSDGIIVSISNLFYDYLLILKNTNKISFLTINYIKD